ncbi:hypothetical protein KRX11_02360 [Pasteurellaceae bacterium TAE3-ERU1]|nr:hypothetical protein [Pasteurellaceae bacterium TAE3-ERU1]
MISILVFVLSGCSILFYREPYTLYRYAEWVNADTNEPVSNKDFGFCYNKGRTEIMGREVNEDLDIGLDDTYKAYPIRGKCLYDKGYVFKVRHFIVYCYHNKEECSAYKNYMRLDFDTKW